MRPCGATPSRSRHCSMSFTVTTSSPESLMRSRLPATARCCCCGTWTAVHPSRSRSRACPSSARRSGVPLAWTSGVSRWRRHPRRSGRLQGRRLARPRPVGHRTLAATPWPVDRPRACPSHRRGIRRGARRASAASQVRRPPRARRFPGLKIRGGGKGAPGARSISATACSEAARSRARSRAARPARYSRR